MDVITALGSLPGSTLRAGLGESAITAAEQQLGLTFPDIVYQFYARCDGIALPQKFNILSLSAAVEYAKGLRAAGVPERWGYLPMVDASDSNPICVCCASPLAGYVVCVNHGDDPTIVGRGLAYVLGALWRTASAGDYNLDNLAPDFARVLRSPADVSIAHELIDLASGLGDDRSGPLLFAVSLLGFAQVAELGPLLLDDPDEYVREAALHCLELIGTPDAAAFVATYREQFSAFVREASQALVAVGIASTVVNDASLRLEPAGQWLNMETFFGARKSSFVMDRIEKTARRALAQP
jgi:hypothetical protein